MLKMPDSSYYIRPGEITLKLDPKETCLIVLDMQKGFGAPDGSFGRFDPNYTEAVQKVVPVIRTAIDYCHKAGIPVMYSQQTHVLEFFKSGLHAFVGRELEAFREAGIRICVKGTEDTEILDDLMPGEKDYVLEKNKGSFFYMTWLELWLRYFHTKTLLITGCATGSCVFYTTQDAYARDLDVIIVEDGVNDPVPYIHDTIIELIDRRFGRVIAWKNIQDVLDRFPDSVTIPGAKP
jgi:nicotinamidase-related amidase